MRENYNFRENVWRRMVCCLALSVAVSASAAPEPEASAPAKPAQPGVVRKRHPLVVLRQSQIGGRVFFLPDEDEGVTSAAAKLDVSVYTRDGSKLLHKTVTGDDGTFVLPDLDVGVYQLHVGALALELGVEGRTNADERPIPKTLLVYMPKDLER
jgi:hypothetical protein